MKSLNPQMIYLLKVISITITTDGLSHYFEIRKIMFDSLSLLI